MRWRYSFCLVVLAILSIAGLGAQGVTYPEPVRKLFEKADAEITEYYHSGKILRYALRRAQDTAQNDIFRIIYSECQVQNDRILVFI